MQPKGQVNVLIYSGPGTCAKSVSRTLKCLRSFLKHAYDVKTIALEEMVLGPWDRQCALFVMPGGRDVPYLDSLHLRHPQLLKTLSDAVGDGRMKYLGICAGAYFASNRVEFEMGREGYEVCADRPLALLPCTAHGSVNANFHYDSDAVKSAMVAISVDWPARNVRFPVLCNGGCYFRASDLEAVQDVEKVVLYDTERAAIVMKAGSWCLSGVHFEYELAEAAGGVDLSEFEGLRGELALDVLLTLGLDAVMPNAEEDALSIKIKTFNCPDTVKFVNDEQIVFESILDEEETAVHSFRPKVFYEQLPTSISSTALLWSSLATSTQTILLDRLGLCDSLPSGTVFVADHQTAGRGRGSNSWISSSACLQFTLLLKHPMALSSLLPLIQFLMAIALAETVHSFAGSEGSSVRIKWPNDIYLLHPSETPAKLSGILVNSVNSLKERVFLVFVGVGFNLLEDESLLEICHLNSFLKEPVGKEAFLAAVLALFHELYSDLLLTGMFPFNRYYAAWMHSNQQIQVALDDPVSAVIKGVDSHGYLLAESRADGQMLRLEPNGNSFDMFHNLIRRKQ